LGLARAVSSDEDVEMAFFTKKKLQRIRIEIDETGSTADSPEIQKRLSRIAENYAKLDEVLAGVEDRFQNDEAFQQLLGDDVPVVEAPKKKKKRKWRPRKPR